MNVTRAAALAVLVFLSVPALAAEDAAPIGVFGDWNAYSFTDNGQKVCFISAKPSEAKGNYKKRGDVMLFVTHWPDAKTKNVVSVSAGYGYKKGSDAVLKIDGKEFRMATEGETAWSRDESDDEAISAAIRKGSKLTVDGQSGRGTKTTDTYDLKGSSDALEAIEKGCGS